MNRVTQFALAAITGMLLTLSFPNYNLGLIAYFAFIPLFFALRKSLGKEVFGLSYLCGLFFFGLTIFWVHHVSILGYILLILILSVFFGIFGIFFVYAMSHKLYAMFIVPAFWVVLEYVRSNLFTGFGWALLGHSQYLNLPVIQISDITGAYGVSFLVIMVNLIIYKIFCDGFKKTIAICLIGLFIVCSVLGYGYFKLNNAEVSEKSLNISLIQGNIPQGMKWDTAYRNYIFNTYSTLTRDAGKDRPDLIIWPETALPGFVEDKALLKEVEVMAKDVNAYILAGAPSLGDPDGETIFNSAVLISKQAKIIKQYNKLHLVPFGEYIPFGKYLNFLRNFIDKPIGDFVKGDEYTIFELDNALRFATLICFEDIFSNLVRNFVLKDLDFLVNITNDAWFMKTGAPYQHAQSSVFRAVENRIPVLRAANTGLSCFIDRYGRITDSVKSNNEEIFIAGYKTKRIHILNEKSFYSKFGDIFTFFCIIALMINGGWGWSKRYRHY